MLRRADKPLAKPDALRDSFWLSPTLGLGLLGSLLLFLAFPPVSWSGLVWIAPLAWLWLIRLPQLPGRRPYLALWLAGCSYWLAMLQGIRLAHPALYGGWIALACYLAFYLPVFVGLTRVAVHRLKISIVVAAPVVWVGLELVRGHIAGGFSAALLSHTLANQPTLIQIADLGGAYLVSLVVMLVAACLARMLPVDEPKVERRTAPAFRGWTLWPVAVFAVALAATISYGRYRLNQLPPGASREPVRVALVQGSLDTVFNIPPERIAERIAETFAHYRSLTDQVCQSRSDLDLVVWPESMFMIPERIVEEPIQMPADAEISPDEFRHRVAVMNVQFEQDLAGEAARVNPRTGTSPQREQGVIDQEHPTMLIVATTTLAYGPTHPKQYNAAILADPAGRVVGRYYKMEAVMFGEYIPLVDLFPWIYQYTPMQGGGLSVGRQPQVFDVAGLRMSPSICFESVIPHLIRSHVVQLQRQGTPPDVLVNVTNDGWFWGSAILDHHFRCAIFRAIENRKPMVIAANTGLAAWIDGNGVVQQVGQRRKPQVLVAEVRPDGRTSPYHTVGDVPAWLCAGVCLILAVVGWRKRPAT